MNSKTGVHLLYLAIMIRKEKREIQPLKAYSDFGKSYLGCGWVTPSMQPAAHRQVTFSYYHIAYVISGQAKITLPQRQVVHVNQGDMLFRPPLMAHLIQRPDPQQWHSFYCAISPDIYHAFKPLGLFPDQITKVHAGKGKRLHNACVELLNHIAQNPIAESRSRMHHLLHWLDHMMAFVTKKNELPSIDQKIHEAANLLSQKYDQPIDLKSMAHTLGLGYESFRKAFRTHMGISPMAYHITHRIKHAQSLLLETDIAVQTLADELGYTDVFTFSRQFKQFTGQSPRTFRNQST